MAAIRHIGFSKVGNFNFWLGRPNVRHRAKFREGRSNRSRDMADCRFFKMEAAGWGGQEGRTASARQPNFVEIAQTAAEIWRFFNFSRWRPSAILDFQKWEISTSGPVRRPNVRHRAKFCEDRSNRSRYMANFQFFKMAAVRHPGFILRVLGPLTKSSWWS